MVNLTVYGNERAACTQKVLILLEELNLKYTFRSIDLSNNEQKDPEYMKMQPFGKIPVIQYGDNTIFESRSILRYIASNNQEIEDLMGDHEVDMWLEVESQNFNGPISKIVYEKLFKKWKDDEAKVDEAVVDNCLDELKKVLEVYDKRLEDNLYIGGNENGYSIADISHIPYFNYFIKCGYKNILKKYPNVYNWLKRIMKRECVKGVLKSEKEVN
jgi:glutathione S-transferase